MLTHRRLDLRTGVVLDLAEGGRAGGRAVMVLHGEDGPASVAATVAHLGVEHRVIAPTHPGWAGAERAASLNAMGALSRAYLDLLAAVDAVDVVVVGASFGGWVGAQMALGDVEGRIGALVLIGPVGALVPGQAVHLPAAFGPRGPRGSRGAALRAYVGPVAHDPTLLARLGAVGVPALVVCGSEDEVASPAHGRAWVDALGDARLVVVDGAGHLPSYRTPGTMFATIDTFLSAPLTFAA